MRTSVLALFLLALVSVVPVAYGQDHVYLDADQSEIKVIDRDKLELHYYGNVKFKYKGADLQCDTAVWYESSEIIEFWSNVVYSDSIHSLKAHYLKYLQAENRFIATGDCELIQRDERVKIRGERVAFDRETEELLVTDSPYLAVDYDDPIAMIEIRSDTLHYVSQTRYGKAIDNVEIVKGSMLATCNMCEFFPDSNLILLEGNPHARQRQNELEGDTMQILLKERLLDQIVVLGDGLALYRKPVGADDTLFTESTVEAKKITFFLKDEVMETIISAGNSYSWYTPAPEDTVAEGKNEASGDSILLYFGADGLQAVEIRNSCVGKFFSQMEVDSLGSTVYRDTVLYEASRLDYNTKDRIIHLIHGANIKHQAVTLDADTIKYSTVTKDLRAYAALKIDEDDEGNVDSILIPVVLRDGPEEMTGDRLVYNLESKRGKVRELDTEMEQAYYHGEVARKIDEDVLLVENGRYTTCDLSVPHFHFGSSNMKLIEGDRVIARPIVLYIEGLPVFYAPYFVFSIKKGRHSGFLPFRYGSYQSGQRKFENVGYYWAISDYWDLETSFDVIEDYGVKLNGQARYAKRYVMNGWVRGSYNRGSATTFSGRTISNRWSMSANHSHTLSPTASISGSGSFVSDRSYATETSSDINERLNRNLRSQLNFSKRWEGSSLTAVVQSTKDLDQESSTLTLPQVSYRLNSRRLFNPPEKSDISEQHWYHNIRLTYSTDARSFQSKRKSSDGFNWTKHARATHQSSISSPQNLLRYITVNPLVNYTENWFVVFPTDLATEDSLRTDRLLRSWTSSMSLSANMNLYGYFFPPIPGLVGIRHTLTPRASFSYTPKSDLNTDEAHFVGASTASVQSKAMSFSLTQIFQMKYRSGEEERKLDLFNLSSSASYNFEAESRKWSNLSTSLRTTSIPRLSVQVSAVHDLYNPVTLYFDPIHAKLKNISVSTSFSMAGRAGMPSPADLGDQVTGIGVPSLRRGWSVNVGHRYTENRNLLSDNKTITHWITTSARFDLTEHWNVNIDQNYDIRRKIIVSRSINVYRDLHCWEFMFSWVPNGSLKGYYFKINVKQIPEIEFKTEDSPTGRSFFDQISQTTF
ncbi:MAG: hypothetical protein KJ723_10545 [candidate division Zixibacteria bacterium]|nr:hypothetical protein [candidate division Zixibacteria bacterium]